MRSHSVLPSALCLACPGIWEPFINQPSTHQASSASESFGPSHRLDHEELILPPTLQSRERSAQKAIAQAVLSILNLGTFALVQPGTPNLCPSQDHQMTLD